jgi:hypothetical protein
MITRQQPEMTGEAALHASVPIRPAGADVVEQPRHGRIPALLVAAGRVRRHEEIVGAVTVRLVKR